MNRHSFVDDLVPLGADRIRPDVRRPSIVRTRHRPAGSAWLDRAHRALARGDYHTAAFAVRRAADETGETAEILGMLARTHTGIGRLADAMAEARRAVQLAPDDPDHQLTLAGIFQASGNWSAALRCYQAAERLDPGCEAARIGTAGVLLHLGDADRARLILEAIYLLSTDKRLAGDNLALALIEVAQQVPRVRDDHAFYITAPEEVARMRPLLARAADVTGDPDLLAGVARIRRYVDECARPVFVPERMLPGVRRALCLALVGASGLLALVASTAGRPGPPLLVAVLSGATAVAAGLVRYLRVPRWKLNRWAHERQPGPAGSETVGSVETSSPTAPSL